MPSRLSPSARLLLVAGALIAGEACGFALQRVAALWPWMAFLLGLTLLAAYGWGARHLLLPFFIVAGCVLAARTEDARQRILDATCFVAASPPLTLPVESPSQLRPAKRPNGWTASFHSHIGPIPLLVNIPLAEGSPAPTVGETWVCTGRLSFRQSDARRYDRHTFRVFDPASAHRVRTGDHTAAAWFARLGSRLAEQVSIGLGWAPEVAALNRAILLGQRVGLSSARRKTFADAGTIHVFAISGLHVMVLAFALDRLFARLDVQMPLRGLLALPAIAAYVMLAGGRPSAIRAAMMLAICQLAPAFGRRANARAAWSLTAIAVYAHSPERLFDLGCALSFAVMLGIVLWLDWMRGLAPITETVTARQKLAWGLGISFAAWVAGVPLTAQAFGQFSLGGLLANVLVIYFVGWTVRFGAFGLAASFFCVSLAAIANNLSALCTSTVALLSKLVAALPFACIKTPFWTVWHSVAWYGTWLAICLAAGRFIRHRDFVRSGITAVRQGPA